jgi:hypothetical protein
MGLILSFSQAKRIPLARRSDEIPAGGAEILFFTGVRYCRWAEPQTGYDGAAPSRGKGSRTGSPRRKARA